MSSYLGRLAAKLAVGFCVTRERNYSSAPIVRVCLFFFLVFFFSPFSALMIFQWNCGTSALSRFKRYHGLMVSSSRICTVPPYKGGKGIKGFERTRNCVRWFFLTVAIWNFGTARNYTGVTLVVSINRSINHKKMRATRLVGYVCAVEQVVLSYLGSWSKIEFLPCANLSPIHSSLSRSY